MWKFLKAQLVNERIVTQIKGEGVALLDTPGLVFLKYNKWRGTNTEGTVLGKSSGAKDEPLIQMPDHALHLFPTFTLLIRASRGSAQSRCSSSSTRSKSDRLRYSITILPLPLLSVMCTRAPSSRCSSLSAARTFGSTAFGGRGSASISG